ncbi:MAG: coenzyme F420-0:L-glutamate ligase [Nitrososphaerota archaeon]|nr:coenzyme F420-0:L-glutamate ligase [Nitrososphaerota archaeon]MDG7047175.1 coenzyme F420-0:L-glutamate ligase [Nitrososphaerota archaeon]
MNEDLSTHLEIFGVEGIPEIKYGDDLPHLIYNAITKKDELQDGDIIVVTSKIVSKAEGRYIDLNTVKPSDFAKRISNTLKKNPREVEVILRESKSIIKIRRGIIIVESNQGVICANAGIDRSNLEGDKLVLLLPKDPDRSARWMRREIEKMSKKRIALLITDTYSRAWRDGHIDYTIGASGLRLFRDYRGKKDHFGRPLRVTNIAQADELAAASELVMGKSMMIPVAVIRNYKYEIGEERAIKLNRPIARDLFR